MEQNGFSDISVPWSNESASSSLPADHFDGVLKYLNQILMEDLDQRACMYQDISALQAAEKSFQDALLGADLNEVCANRKGSRGKRNHDQEEPEENSEGRRKKQFASYTDELSILDNEVTEITMYDKALLCPKMNPGFYDEEPPSLSFYCKITPESLKWDHKKLGLPEEPKGGRPKKANQRPNMIREVVDLNSLLTQCAQAVANFDNRTSQELLVKIRQHSSPSGDATERMAHYFADALEARVSGAGATIYTAARRRKMSAKDILKAYQSHILACPFRKMSNLFADKSIGRLTRGVNTIHIIDFGILYGFQWPCLIQGISLRPGGPPKLRITGIDLPQTGFRPAERIEETGQRLSYFCERFNVPFEYHTIAVKEWETITLEDLKLDRSETIIVNCLYRMRNVPDETAESSSARTDVLGLIRKIKPDLFVHGVLNGTYNVPFFVTRFKEAMHHFSSLFDMFDKTLPRHDQDRMVFEREIFGRDCMNVIACEGKERFDRPETYKQWQVRILKAGFKQLPLNQDIVREVRAKVKLQYHKDFLVDEDCNWMLQGWKGRVIYALSCWKPDSE
ncbi:OLC1v1007653C1 [Oldenlandia corymbosa var. corymbosa]|uniref:OLC1v1007653C1 n=1 Tax=Oldenlandia corymbosa var. corymbosa TaxID=529605 RepID=A0AAV1DJZ1_OLDCO|nr:OLC1v1007653C1 [Oldenlandia corymbosa var. corymbosa]